MQDGESVTQHVPQRTGALPHKRCRITTPEVLESEGDVIVAWKMPKGSNKEQVLWRITHALEQLVDEW